MKRNRSTVLSLIAGGTLMAGAIVACSSSNGSGSPGSSTTEPAEFGSAAEAIRQLGKNDADVVQRCEQLAQRCEAFASGALGADAGDVPSGIAERVGDVCEKISEHCTELAEQLSAVREELQACLERVAECEASDADASECRELRRECTPAGRNFEDRRGATLACAERTQSCLPRGRMGQQTAAEESDAGAVVCDDDALDFAGCCRGGFGRGPGRGGDGDAGVSGPRFGGRADGLNGGNAGGPRGPRFSGGSRRGNEADRDVDGADDAAADDSND